VTLGCAPKHLTVKIDPMLSAELQCADIPTAFRPCPRALSFLKIVGDAFREPSPPLTDDPRTFWRTRDSPSLSTSTSSDVSPQFNTLCRSTSQSRFLTRSSCGTKSASWGSRAYGGLVWFRENMEGKVRYWRGTGNNATVSAHW
jgi:hypothetical protein